MDGRAPRWLLSIALLCCSCAAEADCEAGSGRALRPLVELYTAEGCNQCPAADAWLSAAARGDPRTSWLAFHVDYWDEVGWVDRFAAAAHGQRQKYRLAGLGQRALFTPQVLVGSAVPGDWRGAAMSQLLKDARRGIAPATLAMSVHGDAGARLRVSMQARLDPQRAAGPAWLWLALYEDGLRSTVTAGENAGRQLRHDRVVRALAGPWPLTSPSWSGDVVLAWPEGMQATRAGLVLFAESPADGRGLQSLEQRLSACVAQDGG